MASKMNGQPILEFYRSKYETQEVTHFVDTIIKEFPTATFTLGRGGSFHFYFDTNNSIYMYMCPGDEYGTTCSGIVSIDNQGNRTSLFHGKLTDINIIVEKIKKLVS
jgi:hypothetical protein